MRTRPHLTSPSSRARHAGAPIGNQNALKHGRYAGGRHLAEREKNKAVRESLAAEMRPIHRLERRARAHNASRHGQLDKEFEQFWNGIGIRKYLGRLIGKFETIMKQSFMCQEANYNYACAARDVLFYLCQEEKHFTSKIAFLDAICNLFLSIDDNPLPKRPPGSTDRSFYYHGWRRFCADLYERYNPPISHE